LAYAWLLGLMLLLTVLVTGAAMHPIKVSDLQHASFVSLFALHAILIVFLVGWWILAGRPPLTEYLSIRREEPGTAVLTGVAVGFGGWISTLLVLAGIALALKATGVIEGPQEPPEMVGWLAALPLWKKLIIILSAMTVEEAFFRAWLQKRVGLIASTILFALAHFTYAQPLFVVGVTLISLVIGATYYRTKNILPGVIAHGVFDSIQLLVLAPLALKMTGHA
ncbi:MAG TPA: type II CAAX endopeptidase family protein, partial [Thermoanaerobaculia bacterium]|nr:type II CAAX endopeptidase family protein [Thermoanaerobaculia bacterium]